jgi:chaperonin GroES
MPTFTPLDDQVLIRRSPPKDRSAGGLVLPGTSQERPLEGEVLAVGPGRWLEHRGERLACQVQVGDQVLFRKYGGTDLVFDGVECLVVREGEILGVVT